MGLHLPKNTTLDGIPVSTIKKIVNRHRHQRFPYGAHQDVYAALVRRGWITGGPAGDLSQEARALGTAVLRARTPLAKADAVFETLKTGIAAINADGLMHVHELWIFGSYMRRAATIGDIDAGLHLLCQPGLDHDRVIAALEDRFGHESWFVRSADDRHRWTIHNYAYRLLYPTRRPLLCDGVRLSLCEVEAGMAVQRVYTYAGGWHHEPILDQHPNARGPLPERTPLCIALDQGTFSTTNTTDTHAPAL